MTRQQKIDYIYEHVADKTLSFGCKIKKECHLNREYSIVNMRYKDHKYGESFDTRLYTNTKGPGEDEIYKDMKVSYYDEKSDTYHEDGLSTYPIIGHRVMIGNIINFVPRGPDFFEDIIPFIDVRTELEKPLEDQTAHCVDFIHAEIQKIVQTTQPTS